MCEICSVYNKDTKTIVNIKHLLADIIISAVRKETFLVCKRVKNIEFSEINKAVGIVLKICLDLVHWKDIKL